MAACSFNIRLVLDMLDYGDFIDKDCLILFLDFYKAFHTVEHAFLLDALKFLGFGEIICKLIEMFYSDIYSSVSINPGLSSRFKIQRGIRRAALFPPNCLSSLLNC